MEMKVETTGLNSSTRILKWVSGGIEGFLGIPLIGGMFILGLYWTPLLLMLVFHIVSLVLTVNAGRKKTGHILGIIASAVGWIPVAGMILHILAAIFLLMEAAKNE